MARESFNIQETFLAFQENMRNFHKNVQNSNVRQTTNFIQYHYKEILHNLQQINYHMEQIESHCNAYNDPQWTGHDSLLDVDKPVEQSSDFTARTLPSKNNRNRQSIDTSVRRSFSGHYPTVRDRIKEFDDREVRKFLDKTFTEYHLKEKTDRNSLDGRTRLSRSISDVGLAEASPKVFASVKKQFSVSYDVNEADEREQEENLI